MFYPLALLHLHISNTRNDNTASAACSSQVCVCVLTKQQVNLAACRPAAWWFPGCVSWFVHPGSLRINYWHKEESCACIRVFAHSVCVTGEALSAWLLLKINPGLMILTQAGCSLLALKDTSHRVPRAHTGGHMTGRRHSKVPRASRSRIRWFAREIMLLPRFFFNMRGCAR